MEAQFTGRATGASFPGRLDIDQMPETPHRGSHHRRAQSEIFFRFTDDILFDPDVDFNLSALDLPSLSEDNTTTTTTTNDNNDVGVPMTVDSTTGDKGKGRLAVGTHFRSLSVDSDFFDGLGFQPSPVGGDGGGEADKFGGRNGVSEKRMHRHSSSMDGSSSSFEVETLDSTKKALGPDKLAELALIDPKRAKRILANRQSAARSKERKIRYTSELERKVQTLQTEATTLSAQVTMLQRDTTGLTSENKELKLRLQAMEQQAQLRDALNETLREEVQRLRIATGQGPVVNGNSFTRGLPPPFFTPSQTLNHFGNHQTQQQQQQLRTQSSPNGPTLRGQPQQDFQQRT
ncbi:transcription factor VIP1-like [Telopea speciosissima]|uniref:transcription factor VIP1-like n=1 Tax=Telopea speciosissima TaxID=54955 RepID=UPI001CC4746D|nr:transcription factor VIP1-like [Telopea speciosissima]XP_043697911.1 transcription factor VIP1-like [Telopea speciosissima]